MFVSSPTFLNVSTPAIAPGVDSFAAPVEPVETCQNGLFGDEQKRAVMDDLARLASIGSLVAVLLRS